MINFTARFSWLRLRSYLWGRTPRAAFSSSSEQGEQYFFGELKEAKRKIRHETDSSAGKTRVIGYWNVSTDEFVSTDPLLASWIRLDIERVISGLASVCVEKGVVAFCPICNKALREEAFREFGLILRWDAKRKKKNNLGESLKSRGQINEKTGTHP